MHTVSHALVLRSVDYRDSDSLLTLLTREEGKLTATARGSRKRNSTLNAGCQLLCWSEMELYTREERWYVKTASPERQFEGLRRDFGAFGLACHLAELAESLAVEGESCPDLLSLLLNSLHALERLDLPRDQVEAVFELRAMCLAGFAPLLDACGICGEPEPGEPCFHPREGILHCAACLPPGDETLPLDRDTLAAMRYICTCPDRRIFSFRLPKASRDRLVRITRRFVEAQTDRRYPTLDYYLRLCP